MGTGGRQMTLDLGTSAPRDGAGESLGEVFTRRWVVDLILDLAGYTDDKDLGAMRAIEPSCGSGAFLGPMVERLIRSCALHGRRVADLRQAIQAFDLMPSNAELAREAVAALLRDAGLPTDDASAMAASWVKTGDFLLTSHDEGTVDFVLGNPPYIRLEHLPVQLNAAYRDACPTMGGRSDIFIGFIELGLRLLRPDGVLGFIVADRWMRNQYGAGLRAMVGDRFSVEAVVEMHDVDAFEDDVSAYPAVTVIRNRTQGKPFVAATTRAFSETEAARLSRWASNGSAKPLTSGSIHAARLDGWFRGSDSWPSGTPEKLAVLADLERRFPPLADRATGTKVGIGLATGADDVFLTTDVTVAETDRLLPTVMAKDLTSGRVEWSGTYLVNPWQHDGLVELDDWPKLHAYLVRHAARVKSRHTALKNPSRWWRTIDRVTPGLLETPKILLPEMKATAHPVLDDGAFYPHHNVYYVTSQRWDLEVLGGILLSDVTNLFVGAYCVKMRGGTYRFQAQYLRRIRVPDPTMLTTQERRALARAFSARDREAATSLAARLYGIDRRVLSTVTATEVGGP